MSLFLPLLLITATEFQIKDVHLEPTMLTLLSLAQPPKEPENSKLRGKWGQKGTWRWGIHGGHARELEHHENKLTTLGVEFDYFIAEDLSIDIGLDLVDISQIGEDADGFNLTLQLRWHAIAKEDWSFFLEGGVGLLWSSDNVPVDGSDFNFTPEFGLGFSFDAGDQARWLLGLRWHHISNANAHRSNPGRDNLMVWAGITFPF